METLQNTQELLYEQLERISDAMDITDPTTDRYQKLEAAFNNVNANLLKVNQKILDNKNHELEVVKVEQNKKSKLRWFGEKVFDVIKVAAPPVITGVCGLWFVDRVSKHEETDMYGRQTGNLVNETYKNMNRKY